MATAHLPSIVPTHAFVPFDPLKTEKYLSDEHEYEISNWLKLENEPLPGVGTYSTEFYTNSSSPSVNSQLPTLQSEFSHNYASAAFNFSLSCSSSASQNTQLPPPQTPSTLISPTSQPQFATPQYSYQYTYPSQYPTTVHYTTSQPQYNTNQYSSPPFSSNGVGVYGTQYAPPPFTSSQYSSTPYSTHYIQPNQYPSSTAQYTQSIVPSQLFQPQYSNGMTSTGNFQQHVPTQYQYVFSQFHPQQMKNQGEEVLSEDKKRKAAGGKPFVRRVRQTRPKVVEAKGAVQCKGRNRKKGTQCRNAALMEYIGPRPIYCAEHIELDPKSLYEKCKSSYQKDPGDNKGCKEVVLKEFGVCYKHYGDLIQEMIDNRENEKAQSHAERINDLLSQLERDASAAKKKDGDLYQRKNKLIPKFQEMKKSVCRAVELLEMNRNKDLPEILPTELTHLTQPILLDRMALHIVQAFSDDDDQSLSSPLSASDSSLDEEFEHILN